MKAQWAKNSETPCSFLIQSTERPVFKSKFIIYTLTIWGTLRKQEPCLSLCVCMFPCGGGTRVWGARVSMWGDQRTISAVVLRCPSRFVSGRASSWPGTSLTELDSLVDHRASRDLPVSASILSPLGFQTRPQILMWVLGIELRSRKTHASSTEPFPPPPGQLFK